MLWMMVGEDGTAEDRPIDAGDKKPSLSAGDPRTGAAEAPSDIAPADGALHAPVEAEAAAQDDADGK